MIVDGCPCGSDIDINFYHTCPSSPLGGSPAGGSGGSHAGCSWGAVGGAWGGGGGAALWGQAVPPPSFSPIRASAVGGRFGSRAGCLGASKSPQGRPWGARTCGGGDASRGYACWSSGGLPDWALTVPCARRNFQSVLWTGAQRVSGFGWLVLVCPPLWCGGPAGALACAGMPGRRHPRDLWALLFIHPALPSRNPPTNPPNHRPHRDPKKEQSPFGRGPPSLRLGPPPAREVLLLLVGLAVGVAGCLPPSRPPLSPSLCPSSPFPLRKESVAQTRLDRFPLQGQTRKSKSQKTKRGKSKSQKNK